MSEWKMVGKPALILIHMQHGICHEAGTVAFLGHAKATKDSGILLRQHALLKAFRAKKLPIIYVNAVTDPKSVLSPYGKFYPAITSTKANLPGSKDIEVLAEVAPQPGEPVLQNWVFGIFSNSGLEKILKDKGVTTLVMAGVATDMAVLTSVLQAADLFYNMIVPSDASTSANPKAHDVAMNMMIPAMALVTTTEDIIAHL
ncbi:MAG: cysteine hydrolase [Pseudomonadota bacterium]